jgi:hypothetical protein
LSSEKEKGMEEQKNTTYKYRTVPVDFETHRMILVLCNFYEMGKRAQGALIRRLVKAEYRKISESLLPDDQVCNPVSVSQTPE